MAKYGHVAEQNNLLFIPAVFSHTGQIHDEFKALVRGQIRHKLIDVKGEPKSSKIKAGMKWWTKCISMAIAKTARSRNVAFKVARMRDAIMQDQYEFITRNANFEDVALVANDRAIWRILDVTLTCILPIKKMTLKFRRLTCAALISASNIRGFKSSLRFS